MNDCLIWKRAKTRAGYGVKKINGQVVYLHRLAMEEMLGRPLRSNEHVHHKCETKSCYRIDHLSLIDPVIHGYNYNRKISDEDVALIRRLRSEDLSYRKIESVTVWSQETARRWCKHPKGHQRSVIKRKSNNNHE